MYTKEFKRELKLVGKGLILASWNELQVRYHEGKTGRNVWVLENFRFSFKYPTKVASFEILSHLEYEYRELKSILFSRTICNYVIATQN